MEKRWWDLTDHDEHVFDKLALSRRQFRLHVCDRMELLALECRRYKRYKRETEEVHLERKEI